ncbi:MAG: DNA-binding response regulator [Gemmatimonadetes bacterium]|nr:MAG: DNA-binding response regulator [Gemmatimonadota bacterium]
MRVAIVDDEELARERMRALLSEHSDIEVVAECADGAEALRAIDDKNPDLVFLDVQMPEVDGFDVIEALERGDPEAPPRNGAKAPAIVFVTAHDDHALKAFEIHALDFLLKPFDEARFEKTLSRARRHVRQARETVDESMKNMEARLDPNTFVRIHRSAIVNIDRVKELEPWFHGEYIVIMRDGTRLTASRVYSDRLSALIE